MRKVVPIVYKQLLALIRLAITGKMDEALLDSTVDWKSIRKLADEHSVTGLAFAGVEHLPQDKLPEVGLLMNWFSKVEVLRKQKVLFDSVMGEFAKLMDENEIPYVVFKGLAAASKYPVPEQRAMGDIDFYVPQSDFDRAVETIERSLGVAVSKDDIDKHFSFDWRGVRFEMHYQMETFGCMKHQNAFSDLVDSCFTDGTLEYFLVGDGTHVPMLSPSVDLMLVFKHLFTHLLGEGVGLRQLTDVAVLIMEYQTSIDVVELRNSLRQIGYLKGFDAMVALVERYYCIEWSEYSAFLDSASYRRADTMLATILKNGNFGRSDYRYRSGFMKRAETTLRFFKHCFRFLPLAPLDILCLIPKRVAISLRAH